MMKIKIPTNFNYYQDSMIPVGSVVDGDCNVLSERKRNKSYSLAPLTLFRSDLANYKHLVTSSIVRKQINQDEKKMI